MGSPVVYDFHAFSKLKTIVKHSLQINFTFPGPPGCVSTLQMLCPLWGGEGAVGNTPGCTPFSARLGPRPEVAMTVMDASPARTVGCGS